MESKSHCGGQAEAPTNPAFRACGEDRGPVHLGEGPATRAPVGTAVIGDMITSMLLPLVVIPRMYSLIDGASRRIGQLFTGRRRTPPPAEPKVVLEASV